MKNNDFTYSFASSKTAGDIFKLLLQVPEWWSGIYQEKIKGKSENLADEFTFKAGGGAHFSKQKLEELFPNKRIVWKVTDSNLNFLDRTDEWTGTRICFDIAESGGKTKITFTHQGLNSNIECYDGCAGAWTQYMKNLEQKLK